MKTFTKSMLAVTGLALSLAACGPGLQGSGAKKPNLQTLFLAFTKAERAKAQENPNIKSIIAGETVEDEMHVKIELDNVADLEDSQKSLEGLMSTKAGEVASVDTIKGTLRDYSIELMCIDDGCKKIGAVLTASVKSTEEPIKAEQKKEIKKDEKEPVATQAGTTAAQKPEASFLTASVVKTGVIVDPADGTVLYGHNILDLDATIEKNVQEMISVVGEGESLKVNFKKK